MNCLSVWLILVLSLVGCDRNSGDFQAVETVLLEGQGRVMSPDRTWTVTLTDTPPGLVVERDTVVLEIVDSPVDWNTSEGAFVFFDSDSRVWAYDGDARSFIVAQESDTTTFWEFETWPKAVPVEVVSRVGESAFDKGGKK